MIKYYATKVQTGKEQESGNRVVDKTKLPVLCPQRVAKSFKTGIMVKKKVAMFAGYIFIGVPEDRTLDKRELCRLKGVFSVIEPAISSVEVEQIKESENKDIVVSIGECVEVLAGPFAGCKGTIINLNENEEECSVSVIMGEQKIDVLVPSDLIEKVQK